MEKVTIVMPTRPSLSMRSRTHNWRLWISAISAALTVALVASVSVISFAAAGELSSLTLTAAADGTAPFDADDAAGNDSSASNGIVRGMDAVTYRWDYAVSTPGDITFTQTLPIGMVWLQTESLASCTGTPSNISADQRTITCTLPNRPVGVGSYLVKARLGAPSNGATLETKVTAGALTSNTNALTASATPMVGLNYLSAAGLANYSYSGVDGFRFNDGLDIFVPANGAKEWRGAESLDSPLTFTVTPPTNVSGATLLECGAGSYNLTRQPGPSGGGANNVVNSGTWTCDQPGGPGTAVTVTVTGMNSSLTSYPTKLLSNNRAYMGVGKIAWFIPRSSLPQTNVTLKFTASNFDPTSSSGVSNYGTGFATNYTAGAACVVGTDTVNGNCVDRTMSLAPQALLGQSEVNNSMSGGGIDGGVLYANQPFAFRATTYNAMTNAPQTNATLCLRWDNQHATINPSLTPVVNYGSGTYLIEYGTVAYASETARRTANCGVPGDANSDWHTSIAAAGGSAGITAVRVTMLTGSIGSGQGINFNIPMTRASTTLPAGTPIVVFSSLRTDQFGWTANSSFNPANSSGLAGARSTASIAKTANTVAWQSSTTAPGTTREVTVTATATNPFMPSNVVTAEQLRLTVTLPSVCQSYVTGSGSVTPEQIIPANAGPDGVPCTSDDVSPAQLVFNLGDAPTGSSIAPITFKTNINQLTSAPTIHTIKSVISTTSDVRAVSTRTATAPITINAVSEFTVAKQASVSKALNGVPFAYTISWANRLSSNAGVAKIVDVLPFNGDNRGTTGVGGLQFVSAASNTSGTSFEYTTMTASALQTAISADPSGDTGVTWVSAQPSSGVTGVRIITPSLSANTFGSATLTIQANGLTSTSSLVNDVSAKAANLATSVVGGSPVTVGTFASSVSGALYEDVDYSWSNSAGDITLTQKQVSYSGYSFGMNGLDDDGAGDDVALSAPIMVNTDSAGKYHFESVDPGKYTFSVTSPTGYSAAQVPTNPVIVTANQAFVERNFGFIVDVPNPVLVNDTSSTAKNVAKSVDVLTNDTLDSSALITAVSAGSNGATVTIAVDGKSVVYTPANGFAGTETFSYTITDKGRQTGSASVTMTVVGPPTAADDEAYVNKNVAKSIGVIANDSGAGITVTTVGTSADGSTAISANGQAVVFTPNTGFTGLTSFTYTLTDSVGQTAEATVTIRVLPPVVAIDDAASTGITSAGVGVPVTIPILSNDSGVKLRRTSFTQPAFGAVTFDSSGQAIYTPNGSQVGTDSFTYTITDPGGQTATATVRVAVFTPPFAATDTKRVKKDTATTIAVLSNDVGTGLEVKSVQGMSETVAGTPDGTAVLNTNGSVTFTPKPGFTGLATFTYAIQDDFGQTKQGTVNITVVAPPVAGPKSLTVGQSKITDVDLSILVTAPVGFVTDSVTQPSLGSATVQSTGSVRYVAPSNASGSTSFTYTVSDDLGQTSTSTITVRVVEAPKAVPDAGATLIDAPVTVNVLTNDSGETIVVKSVETPTNGQVALSAGEVVFTPNAGWFGTEVFTYTIEDSVGQSAMAAVTINVFPTLIAQDISVTTPKNEAVRVPLSLPAGTAVASIHSTPNGTFEIRNDGSVWFTPNGNFIGEFSSQYTLKDGAGQTATANIQVNVTEVSAGAYGSSSSGSLETTGVPGGQPFAVTALLMLMVGAVLSVLRRRRS